MIGGAKLNHFESGSMEKTFERCRCEIVDVIWKSHATPMATSQSAQNTGKVRDFDYKIAAGTQNTPRLLEHAFRVDLVFEVGLHHDAVEILVGEIAQATDGIGLNELPSQRFDVLSGELGQGGRNLDCVEFVVDSKRCKRLAVTAANVHDSAAADVSVYQPRHRTFAFQPALEGCGNAGEAADEWLPPRSPMRLQFGGLLPSKLVLQSRVAGRILKVHKAA